MQDFIEQEGLNFVPPLLHKDTDMPWPPETGAGGHSAGLDFVGYTIGLEREATIGDMAPVCGDVDLKHHPAVFIGPTDCRTCRAIARTAEGGPDSAVCLQHFLPLAAQIGMETRMSVTRTAYL